MNLGEMIATLGCDTKGLDEAQRRMTAFGTQAKKFGDTMKETGVKMSLGLTAPIVAAGGLMLHIANDFKKAQNVIRIGTGATGEDLKHLTESFHHVAQTVANDQIQVAEAIAGINTRLGLVGRPLEELAFQMSNLARITNTEMNVLIQQGTRLFGDWSIATNKQSESLDYMFRVTQKTGIQMARLLELVVWYGAPMRALGFSMEQSAALLGKWEKEGVNMETLLSGLKMGLGDFASAHKDPIEALKTLVSAIKNAGSASEATTLSFKTFGRRAAVDMYRAIVEGRFEIDDLVTSLKVGGDTINKVGEDTLTFSNKMAILWHQIDDALIPASKSLESVLRDNLVNSIKAVVSPATTMIDLFNRLPSIVKTSTFAILGLTAALGPMMLLLSATSKGLSQMMVALVALSVPIQAFAQAIKWLGIGVLTSSVTNLTKAFGPLPVVITAVGAAFAGWKIGEWLDKIPVIHSFGVQLGDALWGLWQKMGLGPDMSGPSKDLELTTLNLQQRLRGLGVDISRLPHEALSDWARRVNDTAKAHKELWKATEQAGKVASSLAKSVEDRMELMARAEVLAAATPPSLVESMTQLRVLEMEFEKMKSREGDAEYDANKLVALGEQIGKMRYLIDLSKNWEEIWRGWKDTARDLKDAQEAITRVGFPEVTRDPDKIKQMLKSIDTAFGQRWNIFQGTQLSLSKELTQDMLYRLNLQQEMVSTIIPMNNSERERIEIENAHLQFAIRAEELRVRYVQTRADIEAKIADLLPSDPLRIKILNDLQKLQGSLDAQLADLSVLESATVLKIHKQEYMKMIDTVRDGAGEVFDAMVSRGRGAFRSLLDWIEGVFLSRLRVLFQNLVQTISTPGEGGGLSRIFEGVIPRFSRAVPGMMSAVPMTMSAAQMAMSTGMGGGSSIMAMPQMTNPLVSVYTPAAFSLADSTAKAAKSMQSYASSASAAAQIGGSLLMSDAYRRGSKIEGAGGGALAGAGTGFMIGGPLGAVIGAGVGAIGGAIAGAIGGAEKRRAEEAARRAYIQSSGFIDQALGFNEGGPLETDITGRTHDWGTKSRGGVTLNIQSINLVDARHAKEAGRILANEFNRIIQNEETALSDTLSYNQSMP